MSELHPDSLINLSHSEIDDLKLIHGIGPAVERRLNSGGIHTYSQLAAQSPDQLARLMTGMTGFTVQRIIEKDWIGQARRLETEVGLNTTQDDGSDSGGSRQHYAVFTVEFLLDKTNRVRRSRAMYVQDQKESAWAGWDPQRMLDFFADCASLNLPASPMKNNEPSDWIPPAALVSPPGNGQKDSQPALRLAPDLRVKRINMELSDAQGNPRLIHGDQPFKIRLTLDFSNVDAAYKAPYEYSATIFAKKLGVSAYHQVVGKSEGNLVLSDQAILEIEGLPLATGVYRLEALVSLQPFGKPPDLKSRLLAIEEGETVQVY